MSMRLSLRQRRLSILVKQLSASKMLVMPVERYHDHSIGWGSDLLNRSNKHSIVAALLPSCRPLAGLSKQHSSNLSQTPGKANGDLGSHCPLPKQ